MNTLPATVPEFILEKVIGAESGRPSQYFDQAKQMSAAWEGTLQLVPDYKQYGSVYLSSLDKLYEQVEGQGKDVFMQLSADIEAKTNVEHAAQFVMANAENTSISFKDATLYVVAFITAKGHELLTAKGMATLAEDWVSEWNMAIKAQNLSEMERTELAASANPVVTTGEKSLNAGIREFLAKFSASSALGVALVGAFPFMSEPTELLLPELAHLAHKLSELMRLAEDIKVDMKEEINAGYYALAVEKGISIMEAKKQLTENQVEQDRVNAAIGQEFESYFSGMNTENTKLQTTAMVLMKVVGMVKKWKGG